MSVNSFVTYVLDSYSTRRKFLTPCSVVLSTFRKLALRAQTVRNASPSDSVAWLNFRMGTMQEAPILIFTPNPARPRSGPTKFWGTQSIPPLTPAPLPLRGEGKRRGCLIIEASRRANAHCLRPQAEFARSSGRGLRRVQNFVTGREGDVQKTTSFLTYRTGLNLFPLQFFPSRHQYIRIALYRFWLRRPRTTSCFRK